MTFRSENCYHNQMEFNPRGQRLGKNSHSDKNKLRLATNNQVVDLNLIKDTGV